MLSLPKILNSHKGVPFNFLVLGMAAVRTTIDKLPNGRPAVGIYKKLNRYFRHQGKYTIFYGGVGVGAARRERTGFI